MSSTHDYFSNSIDAHGFEPKYGSPYLDEELLIETNRIPQNWRIYESSLSNESPFLKAFEEGNRKSLKQENLEKDDELNGEDEFTENDLELEDFKDLLLEQEIIGKDTRVLVKDTLAIPYRWICSLDLHYVNGVISRGTGILIGERYVLTVAHALVSEKDSNSIEKIIVIPARNGMREPLGRVEAKAWNICENWKPPYLHAWQYDYALITLERDIASPKYSELGNQSLGYWGHKTLGQGTIIRPVEPNFLSGKTVIVNIAGYPGDKCGVIPLKPGKGCSPIELQASTQWRAFGKIVEVKPERSLIKHTVDTYHGHSGAPVWLRYKNRRNLVGIHARPADSTYYEKDDNFIRVNNFAVRITKEILTDINSWMNANVDREGIQEIEPEDHKITLDKSEALLESVPYEVEDFGEEILDEFPERQYEDKEENLYLEDDSIDGSETYATDVAGELYQDSFDERDSDEIDQCVDEQESGLDFEDQAYRNRRCSSYDSCLDEALQRFKPSSFRAPVNVERGGKYDQGNWDLKIIRNERGRNERILVLKSDKTTPSKAIWEIVNYGHRWTMECAFFVQVIYLYAVSQMNPEQFDQRWKGEFRLRFHWSTGAGRDQILAFYRRGGSNGRKCQENKLEPWQRYYKGQWKLLDSTWNDEKILDNVPRGSRVMWSHEQGTGAWMNENTVKVGKDQYLAFGFTSKALILTGRQVELLLAAVGLNEDRNAIIRDPQNASQAVKDAARNYVFLCEVVRFRRPKADNGRR
ncbi:trypsin-like peptidase domain-containing protein [Nodosilinea sp. LEGE 07088]|uniref:trypsin-like serine peptidase n=1 Tax=Nodosilinea sp. LEGE 07088 TaxID=2777968 RepID=UPI00187F8671|nr:trypsin-like peptidase domain-containing protein [Nodosilinea sp. LEGE 07088]MBE9136959.1 trypsin-like peptidase domain-containing protein [Nodosilinea sp. LEGE 07088]